MSSPAGIAEVAGSNPVEALIFFRLLLSNCLSWKIYCDDHSSLSLSTNVVYLAGNAFGRARYPVSFIIIA